MQYATQYKTQIEITSLPNILLYSEDSSLALLYTNLLEARYFSVNRVGSLDTLLQTAQIQKPHAVLVHMSPKISLSQGTVSHLKQIADRLPLVTVGLGLPESTIETLMALGIAGFIDRKLSRPNDIPLIMEQVIGVASL